jgi:hypothetical protein
MDLQSASLEDMRIGRPPAVEYRAGGMAVESIRDAAIFVATGYVWPNLLWRQGKNVLTEEHKGQEPYSIEVYRRKDEAGEEWTALFFFRGDVTALRWRRFKFYNAELFIWPPELAQTEARLQAMRDEEIAKVKKRLERRDDEFTFKG